MPFWRNRKKYALKKSVQSVRDGYKQKLSELSQKLSKEKIKVVFLIRENQKWTYGPLYKLFEEDSRFEPCVLVSLLQLSHKGKDKTRNNLEENYNFFKQRNINVDYAYRNGKYIDLKEFNPDIIFYDQPYELPPEHSPIYTSEFALNCYSSYSYEMLDCEGDFTQKFHSYLFKYFLEHSLNVERYGSYNSENAENCVVTGYPKLDVYLDTKEPHTDVWKDNSKFKIIYAPHHSMDKKGIHLATFRENYKYILDFAKKNTETTWIFKPHPRLKYALLRNKIMTMEEIENYYNEWREIGNIYEQGDYFDIFKTSDMMITDGCSFLGEYLPTTKPLIRLVGDKALKLNKLGEMIVSGYYQVYNKEEFEKQIYDIVVNKEDTKKELRENLIKEIIDEKETSSHKIYSYILKTISEVN